MKAKTYDKTFDVAYLRGLVSGSVQELEHEPDEFGRLTRQLEELQRALDSGTVRESLLDAIEGDAPGWLQPFKQRGLTDDEPQRAPVRHRRGGRASSAGGTVAGEFTSTRTLLQYLRNHAIDLKRWSGEKGPSQAKR